ncbi:hypothetical protein EI94DRAFT_1705295 [Lactarius quietus]|nr:hypothetical protein EI94DRAFT_1705295 [Lactarius quietus]
MPLLNVLHTARAFPLNNDVNNVVIGPGEELGSPEFWWKMLTSTFLVLLGGVLSGLTLGLMGLDELHLRVLSTSSEDEKERKDAAKVLKLLNKGRHWVLVVLLLGNVIVNESLPIFLDSAIGGGVAAIVISTTAIGIVHVTNVLIFGYGTFPSTSLQSSYQINPSHVTREIIPQAVSVRYGLSIGARCVPVVLALMYFFAPIAWPIAKLLDHVLGKGDVHTYKKAELKSFLQFHRTGEEPLRDDEISILNGVLELNTKKVERIMTPMKDVVTLSSDTILDARTIESLLLSGYSRFPVHEPGNLLAFSGLLLVKKVVHGISFRQWASIIDKLRSQLLTYDPSQCWPVSKFTLSILPEAKPTINCFQALDYFQTGRAHLLLISNTPGVAGGAIGVITLEDIIEEIIDEEIVDETDRYEDNRSKRRARRMTTAAVMRGWDRREGTQARCGEPNMGDRTPLLSVSPGNLEVGDLGPKSTKSSLVYGSVRRE